MRRVAVVALVLAAVAGTRGVVIKGLKREGEREGERTVRLQRKGKREAGKVGGGSRG